MSKPDKKYTIALIGFMGTGKSKVGRVLAFKMGTDFIDLDEEIVRKVGMSVPEIFNEKGEPYFREIESLELEEALNRKNIVLACGGGIVLKEVNRKLLKEKASVVWLKNAIETSIERCNDGSRPLLNTPDSLTTAYNLYHQREELYRTTSEFSINTDNRSIEDIAYEIFRKMMHE